LDKKENSFKEEKNLLKEEENLLKAHVAGLQDR